MSEPSLNWEVGSCSHTWTSSVEAPLSWPLAAQRALLSRWSAAAKWTLSPEKVSSTTLYLCLVTLARWDLTQYNLVPSTHEPLHCRDGEWKVGFNITHKHQVTWGLAIPRQQRCFANWPWVDQKMSKMYLQCHVEFQFPLLGVGFGGSRESVNCTEGWCVVQCRNVNWNQWWTSHGCVWSEFGPQFEICKGPMVQLHIFVSLSSF